MILIYVLLTFLLILSSVMVVLYFKNDKELRQEIARLKRICNEKKGA